MKAASLRWFILILTWIVLIGALGVRAQDGVVIPLSVGQNVTGEVSAPEPVVRYTIEVGAPQSVRLQVLAITPGFLPIFRVLDPSGVVILDVTNSGTQTIIEGAPNLSSSTLYRIEVSSANGTAGQFLIAVQPGAPLAPPTPLVPGEPLSGSLDAQTTRQAYSFSGVESDVLLINVRSDSPAGSPIVALRDADTGETLGLTSARLTGVRYRIPAAAVNYLLEVTSSGGSAAETFTVCVETETGSVTCPDSAVVVTPVTEVTVEATLEVEETPEATADPNAACIVVTLEGTTINVRGGPGTTFSIVAGMSSDDIGLVIGRLPDDSWFEVNVGGVIGWVSASVVRSDGNCAGVPISQPATSTPTPTPTSVGVNETPTVTSTPTSTQFFVIATLVFPSRLDYTANPNFGEATLSPGFTPDPYSVGTSSGGTVDVAYLGDGCTGYASVAPDFRVHYSGTGSLLRLYFIASSGDTTLIINDPFGNFHCGDDSFGTLNPTIDFDNPNSGTYDIWIGSFASGALVSGTLYMTEADGNHP